MQSRPGPKRRQQRINEQIRKEIADLLMRHTNDPRLAAMVSVTGVEIAPDLSIATVGVSIMGDEDEKVGAMRALRGATGFFRRELGARLSIRHTPDLRFERDDSIDQGARVNELLHQVLPEDAVPAAAQGDAVAEAAAEATPPAADADAGERPAP